ncbi:pyridoxal-phosphate dependent enzyme [Lujinxingia vulgaris]|uniref:tryptophan synthase n=1 Tax=Lujinxingia vulgaris TaxID=2600176 RepID=A0A5C6X942_9DELT|nr:pyridoxal-phosphate dependent enzyme [Lujinxingia vulgaris]TXD38412.1 pyridoxal-phosphate dependent enzyme [Lujinxingia vulgaris]
MGRPACGAFGEFGGRFVAEALWSPLAEVAEAFEEALGDPSFAARVHGWAEQRLGRPTPLSHLGGLSEALGGAQLWLKREDLLSGGSFCGVVALTQALVAVRLGRTELVGETATGDFGVALGQVGLALGLKVRVFMTRDDMAAEPAAVRRMEEMGLSLEPVEGPARGRRGAMAEALRYVACGPERAFYVTSSLASPDPYPRMVAFGAEIIGNECARQLRERGVSADYVVAPVGSGGFACGLFGAFVQEGSVPGVQLVGVQSGGDASPGKGAASLVRGRVGVHMGTRSFVLQDALGQVVTPLTDAAGMAMPVVGPQHARWMRTGQVQYVELADAEAYAAVRTLARAEGILACLESGYALAYALRLAPTLPEDAHVVVGLSGDGARDLGRLSRTRGEGATS